jgi:tRNA (guanine-N7-)-methyltransferase
MEKANIKQIYYGRRKARPLRPGRQSAMDAVLPRILIPGPLSRGMPLAGAWKEVWLEIGFGNGDSLAAWHRAYPEVGFIGCEPFINGVSHLCKLIAQDDLSNIRIWNDTAQPLIDALPDASVDRVYLLNPDPWPKKRHIKRRFIQQESLSALARILKPGGMLVMTTDHAALGEWMLEQTKLHPAFEGQASHTPPQDWLATRYEGKGVKAGRQQVYLNFKRKP